TPRCGLCWVACTIGPRDDGRALRPAPPLHKLDSSTNASGMAQTEQYRRVGKFELHELIREGAMGEVWRAYDSVIRRSVALKLLSRAGRSADARERLLREARAAGALQHPNIVTIYDLGEADGQLFIAMELIDGSDLSTLIALREPLGLERKLDLVIEVLQGLSYAHERR